MEPIKEFNSHKVIVIAQSVIDELFKMGESGVDAITLYNFYYYTSNWQKTRQTKATGGYCRKALHWGKERLINAKKILAEKKLIIEVQKSKKGLFSEVYIQLPYKATEKTTADLVEGQRTADLRSRPAVGEDTNATSVNNINATGVDILEEENYNNIFSNETTHGDDATTGIKENPRPALSTIVEPELDVKNTVKAIQEYAQKTWNTPRIEALSSKTEAKITKLLNKYTLDQFKTSINNALGYTVDIKLIANIVKSEDKFINCLNFIKPEEQTTNRTTF